MLLRNNASFASKSVGTAKTVTATGLSLSGTAAGNYQLTSTTATSTANITARSLTVTATGVNKAYDGTTSATVTLALTPALWADLKSEGLLHPEAPTP